VPTYQYTCTECSEPLEAVQKFSDAPLTVCPACGGRLRKVFSAVGIVFKGSGFYRTDSRNGASATAPAAKDKDKSSSESSSSSTSDSSSSNGSADKAADKKTDKADKKAEPAKASSASEKVA
jgi:putative FmdB family regulatory protein